MFKRFQAGKSTLAAALAERMGLPLFKEPVADNVYLADFYADMARYAFPLQVGVMIMKDPRSCSGVSSQPPLPAASADHLARPGRCPGSHDL